MFYQEKIINGKLCYRHTPNGEWKEFSKARLTSNITNLKKQINAFIKQFEELTKKHEELSGYALEHHLLSMADDNDINNINQGI